MTYAIGQLFKRQLLKNWLYIGTFNYIRKELSLNYVHTYLLPNCNVKVSNKTFVFLPPKLPLRLSTHLRRGFSVDARSGLAWGARKTTPSSPRPTRFSLSASTTASTSRTTTLQKVVPGCLNIAIPTLHHHWIYYIGAYTKYSWQSGQPTQPLLVHTYELI
jgi:hypothetical protein